MGLSSRLARIFHQVAPVYEPSASQNTDFLGANPKANLDRWGYAGLRGAGVALLRSSARECTKESLGMAFICARSRNSARPCIRATPASLMKYQG